MSRSSRVVTGAACWLSAICCLPPSLDATPLDKAACAKIAQDIQNMKLLDVDKLMDKGPDWAVSHLSTGDLELVRQYIDLGEQMKFRCTPTNQLIQLKHPDDDEEEGPKAESAEAEGGKKATGSEQAEGSAQPKSAKLAKKPKRPAQASTTSAP